MAILTSSLTGSGGGGGAILSHKSLSRGQIGAGGSGTLLDLNATGDNYIWLKMLYANGTEDSISITVDGTAVLSGVTIDGSIGSAGTTQNGSNVTIMPEAPQTDNARLAGVLYNIVGKSIQIDKDVGTTAVLLSYAYEELAAI